MFTEQWQTWVLLALGSLLVVGLPILAITFGVMVSTFASAATQAGPYGRPGPSPFPLLIVMGATLLSLLVLVPLSAYFQAGLYKSAFKQLRGGRLAFRDLFSGGDCFLPVLGETILVAILTMIGGMMCVIPGLIVAGLMMFTVPLTVERRLGVMDAMRHSYELTKNNMLLFTLFALLLQLIVGAGSYACYVGLLATYPLLFTITAVAYRDCFGLPGARSFLLAQPSAVAPYAPPEAYTPMHPPVQSAVQHSAVCSQCQTELPPTATFCPRCGARVPS
jgi:ribosomal protein L40E